MSFFKKKAVIIAVIITIAVIIFAEISNLLGVDFIGRGVMTVFSPFEAGVSKIVHTVDDFRQFIWEMSGYREENERLRTENYQLQAQIKSVEEYREENGRLRNLLEFKDSITEYESQAAQVISYEPNNWYDTIVINRGTQDGIQEGDCVVTDRGVVGKVTETGTNWSRVISVLNSSNAIGVKLTRTGDIGVVEGDSELGSEGLCKMSFVDQNAQMIIGDLLQTSGSGGVYPEGLSVGTIKEIKQDNAGTLNYAVVEPAVDFSSLYEVLVLKNA